MKKIVALNFLQINRINMLVSIVIIQLIPCPNCVINKTIFKLTHLKIFCMMRIPSISILFIAGQYNTRSDINTKIIIKENVLCYVVNVNRIWLLFS